MPTTVANNTPRKRMTFVVMASLLLPLVTSCGYLFPTGPETSGNVSLTEVDGELALVQCVSSVFDVTGLAVTSVNEEKGKDESRSIFTGNGRVGDLAMVKGTAISLRDPVGELTTAESGNASIESLTELSTIYVTLSGEQGRIDEKFANVTSSSFEPGQYLYRNGQTGAEPCADGR